MRPKKLEYLLSALSATGFASGLTGAGPFTTFSAPTDGIAHQTTLASTANLSTITFTIVGTDANGNAITDTKAGPNNSTVTVTKYFKTITSITASGTLGANTMNVGWTALCQTPYVVVDFAKLTGPMVSTYLDGTTVTYTMQQTNIPITGEILDSDWTTLGVANSTSATSVQALSGVTAVRLTVSAHTSGDVDFVVSQSRV